jgi:hypothetical protein
MIDRGGGGESPVLMTFFKLALASKFEYELAGDANQSGVAGSAYVLRTKVTGGTNDGQGAFTNAGGFTKAPGT